MNSHCRIYWDHEYMQMVMREEKCIHRNNGNHKRYKTNAEVKAYYKNKFDCSLCTHNLDDK